MKKEEGKKAHLRKTIYWVCTSDLDGKQKKIYAALQLLFNQMNWKCAELHIYFMPTPKGCTRGGEEQDCMFFFEITPII